MSESKPVMRYWLVTGDHSVARLSRDRQEALRLRSVLTEHQVEIPDIPEPMFVEGLRQARDRLAQGGKLGMFAGPAKRQLPNARSTAGSRAPLKISACACER